MDNLNALYLGNDGKVCDYRPSPTNFEDFLTWACSQMHQDRVLPLISKVNDNNVRTKVNGLTKIKEELPASEVDINMSNIDILGNIMEFIDSKSVNIDTIYDNKNSLVALKFYGNAEIPRIVLRLIYLIVPFHTFLTAIYIDRGLNQCTVYELGKIVGASNITDVVLDNTVLDKANYYVLLEDNSILKYLSLARCKLTDAVVKTLACKLVYPLAASKNLIVLNLSTNRITDEGAKYLGHALRSNRKLAYLNLAGNMISDIGVDGILDSLNEFPLTFDEIKDARGRKFTYMREHMDILLKAGNVRTNTGTKRKLPKSVGAAAVKKRKDSIEGGLPNKSESEIGGEAFNDPFNSDNVIIKDKVIYCLGNNTLCYLSLAYNNLSYFSVQKLCTVLNNQRCLNRKPRGLVNICIEGNKIPESCIELSTINFIIEMGLSSIRSVMTTSKKRPGGK